MSDNPRLLAVRALEKVYRKGLTLDQVLPTDTQPLVREIVSGTLRHHFSLAERIDKLLSRKLRGKDTDVRCLLLIGAYQLLHMRVPDHAAVAETVACVRGLKKPWAKGLVNAILRNLPHAPGEKEESSAAARYDHPDWFINALRHALPDHWESVLHANNSRAPMTLRVNTQKTNVENYKQELTAAGIEFIDGVLPETIQLNTPTAQDKLPGYYSGLVAVQDPGAQIAAVLSHPAKGAKVLDACAAPGGKGFHLLERNPGISLRMQDNAAARVTTLFEQADRLGHTQALQIQQGDSTLTRESADSDAERYDLITLDAPCSGSGTVRRHPDIKILRQEHDLTALNATQSALLDALWTRLAPNGRLVYSTCSLFREENDAIIRAFLDRHSDRQANRPAASTTAQQLNDPAHTTPTVRSLADRVPQHASVPGVATEFGWQTLPTLDGGDGLYYCELVASTD